MTTWSIDYAFMFDNGDLCTREMERVGWDKTRDTVLVSEDLATGGIRAHPVSARGNGDPWIAGKIKDDIEEFGYGGAPVRIKSDQEPAIVDVQRAHLWPGIWKNTSDAAQRKEKQMWTIAKTEARFQVRVSWKAMKN